LKLSPREFALLLRSVLMPPGMVRTAKGTSAHGLGHRSVGGPRSVDTQVLTLRRKLELAGLVKEED